ncbi:MAG: M12 family metallopeptidase [Gemmatimonadota bacterium]|nr:M12 family metallopeptidase [Gemmatimonadota bacterium]
MSELLTCTPKSLPRDLWIRAADTATAINPVNHPRLDRLGLVVDDFTLTRAAIAVVTTKYWGTGGVHLTVGFLDNPPKALRTRLLSHMNAWSKTANVKFVESSVSPDVRIARVENDGYWSYVGTDITHIPAGQPTMNLDSFTMNTPESEFHRVVRHETGHTIGCPHEHMRRELVNLIDPAKAITFFQATQGWNAAMTRAQVLTPIEESSLLGTPQSDPHSIMCYQIPGSITKSGQPIVGGLDIDASDAAFIGGIYKKPKVVRPKKKSAPKKKKPVAKKSSKAMKGSTIRERAMRIRR